jgi:hypothetical protein
MDTLNGLVISISQLIKPEWQAMLFCAKIKDTLSQEATRRDRIFVQTGWIQLYEFTKLRLN